MYDNDLDNNNTSSGVTGSESQNSQESTEYRYTSGSMPYNDNSYNSSYKTIHGIPIMAVIIQILIIQTLRATLIIIKRKTRQTKKESERELQQLHCQQFYLV